MTPGRASAIEYPMDIVDMADDFKPQKTLQMALDDTHKVIRYWIYLNNVKWQVELRSNSFECYAAYFKAPSTWSAELSFDLRYTVTNSTRSESFLAYFSGTNHVVFRALKLHEVMNREQLVSLPVELTVTVVNMQNFGMPLHNFFDVLPEQFDTFLIVEERKIRVNKMYLAMMSPFFKALFFGDMRTDEDSYPMPTEKFREMITFLRCIYPQKQPVTKKSLDFLLQMADRYQCQSLVDQCEMFMCAHYHEYQKKVEKCFTYVEKYKMQRLLRVIVEYVSVTQSPTEFRNQPFWKDLSEKTQLTTLDYMAKNHSRRAKEIERRRGVNQRRANIDPVDDQDPPNGRLLGIANPMRNADGRPPLNYQHIVQQPIQRVQHVVQPWNGVRYGGPYPPFQGI